MRYRHWFSEDGRRHVERNGVREDSAVEKAVAVLKTAGGDMEAALEQRQAQLDGMRSAE